MVQASTGGAEQLEIQLASIVSSNDEEAYFAGLNLVERLVGNIIKDPNEQKFRSFKKTNAKIQSTIFTLKGGIDELFARLGFTPSADGEKLEFLGDDLKALKKGRAAIEEAVEPVKLKKMTKEERDKYLIIKQQKLEYAAMQAKKNERKAEAERLQKHDRAEKATEEVVASKANHLNFGANV